MRVDLAIRNKEIVRLRDELGMKFEPISQMMNITTARAHQIYHAEKQTMLNNSNVIRISMDDIARILGTPADKIELEISAKSRILTV